MSGDDQGLPNSLERLEIVSRYPSSQSSDNHKESYNPFKRKEHNISTGISLFSNKSCSCGIKSLHNIRTATSFKKSTNKNRLLKEPVLRIINNCLHMPDPYTESVTNIQTANSNKHGISENDIVIPKNNIKVFGNDVSTQDFKSLLAGCAELKLSSTNAKYNNRTFLRRQSKETLKVIENNSVGSQNDITKVPEVHTSCSQQALIRVSPPCDVTIDELACYFETFVHIPKKMSTMAEMMYI